MRSCQTAESSFSQGIPPRRISKKHPHLPHYTHRLRSRNAAKVARQLTQLCSLDHIRNGFIWNRIRRQGRILIPFRWLPEQKNVLAPYACMSCKKTPQRISKDPPAAQRTTRRSQTDMHVVVRRLSIFVDQQIFQWNQFSCHSLRLPSFFWFWEDPALSLTLKYDFMAERVLVCMLSAILLPADLSNISV